MLLLRAREAVMQRFRRMLRDNGLTEQQWRVLRALSRVEPVEVSRLARSTFLLGPSLSRILPDLKKQALIRVDPDARDQRCKLVRLTATGANLMDRIAPLAEAIYADIAKRLGPESLASLQSLLLQLERDLTESPTAQNDRGQPPKQQTVKGVHRAIDCTARAGADH